MPSTNHALVPYLRVSSSRFTGTDSADGLRFRRPAPTSAADSASSARSAPPNTLAPLLLPPPTPTPPLPPPAPLFQFGIRVSSSRA